MMVEHIDELLVIEQVFPCVLGVFKFLDQLEQIFFPFAIRNFFVEEMGCSGKIIDRHSLIATSTGNHDFSGTKSY